MKYLKKISMLFGLIAMISCNGSPDNTLQNSDKKSDSKLIVGYNENIETLALIYNLSESGAYHFNQIPGPRGTLSKVLTQQFEAFRAHEAVVKLNKLLDDGFVDRYDILLGLYNTPLPEFKQFATYPAVYYQNEGLTPEETQARFDDFNESVIKFYQDADLQHHFKNKYHDLYQKIMTEVQAVAPTPLFIEIVETYFGMQRDAYEIIVSAFSFNGIGRAILIDSHEGSKAACLVTSNHLLESDTINLSQLNSFTVGYKDKAYFQEIGIHELIHTFLHETFKENEEKIALINELNYLFTDSLKMDMMKQGYTEWITCFEEHLVRIGEIKIATLLQDHLFVTEYRKECIEKRGFIYFELIEHLLLEYESNRSSYKNFGDFIPVLVNEIKVKLPATGHQ